ncbi:MAG: hypothetical protein NT136_00385 [Candidatus Moranbacteria bacterium]|nr:hypothetical protein [Candidatus Moranbacteria bacterium]
MSISDKIENIRRQPEHIRMRYVLGGVVIVMVFIIIIWIFSLQESFKNAMPEEKNSSGLQSDWNNVREELPSLQDFIGESEGDLQQNASEEGTITQPELAPEN